MSQETNKRKEKPRVRNRFQNKTTLSNNKQEIPFSKYHIFVFCLSIDIDEQTRQICLI